MKKRSGSQTQGAKSGQPGAGKGQKEDVRGSRIYPASGPLPPGPAEIKSEGSLGRREPSSQALMVRPKHTGGRAAAGAAKTPPRRAAARRKEAEELETTPRDIARVDWKEFLDGFSADHEGWSSHIRVFQPDQTASIEAHGLAFEGINVDVKEDDAIVAVNAGAEAADHLIHMVPHTARITVVNANELEIEAADLSVTVVRCEE